MFTAIISLISESIWDIFWKKSLWYWVWWKIHDLLWYPFWLLVIAYFFYVWIDLSKINFYVLISTILILVISVFQTQINQWIYRDEKMSAVIPYTNINKILTIIVSFFIFSDVSKVSLWITLLAIVIIILFSIDFKTLTLPKSLTRIFFVQTLVTFTNLWAWYIILTYWNDIYFLIFYFSWIVLLLFLSYVLNQYKTIKNLPKSFWVSRMTWSSWWIWWFLWLVVIKDLWLSISILLSFLWIWITLLFSYFILKDKPQKKDIILTIIITSLVWLWYYFK